MLLYKNQYHSPIGKTKIVLCPGEVNPTSLDVTGFDSTMVNGVLIQRMDGQNHTKWKAETAPIQIAAGKAVKIQLFGIWNLITKHILAAQIFTESPGMASVIFEHDPTLLKAIINIPGIRGGLYEIPINTLPAGTAWLTAKAPSHHDFYFSIISFEKYIEIVPGSLGQIRLSVNINSVDSAGVIQNIELTPNGLPSFTTDKISIDLYFPYCPATVDDYKIYQICLYGSNYNMNRIKNYWLNGTLQTNYMFKKFDKDDENDDKYCFDSKHNSKTITTTTTVTTTTTITD